MDRNVFPLTMVNMKQTNNTLVVNAIQQLYINVLYIDV